MPKMYYCTECKKRHRTGKIYQDHLKFKEKPNNSKSQRLLLKLAKVNRMIIYRNYDRDGVNFLKELREQIKEKLK